MKIILQPNEKLTVCIGSEDGDGFFTLEYTQLEEGSSVIVRAETPDMNRTIYCHHDKADKSEEAKEAKAEGLPAVYEDKYVLYLVDTDATRKYFKGDGHGWTYQKDHAAAYSKHDADIYAKRLGNVLKHKVRMALVAE